MLTDFGVTDSTKIGFILEHNSWKVANSPTHTKDKTTDHY